MVKYETVLIATPNLTEEGAKALEEKYTNLINSDGKVEKFSNEGVKPLAYEIKKNSNGNWFVINYSANPELQTELNRVLRIDDNLLKFLTIKDED